MSEKLGKFGALMRVLEQASGPLGGTKTWLLYNAGVSHQELERTVEILVGVQLADWRESKLIATPKGLDFIRAYRQIMEQL